MTIAVKRKKRLANFVRQVWDDGDADAADAYVAEICTTRRSGRVRQRGVILDVAPGRHGQAALGVICSGGFSSIRGVTSSAMPSIRMSGAHGLCL
jgi:hypothetical protein